MDTRKTLDHHPIKAELGINIIEEIITVFAESTPLIPRKFVNIIENTLIIAKDLAIKKFQDEQNKKAQEEQNKKAQAESKDAPAV